MATQQLPQDDRILTLQEAADYINTTPRTVERYIADGDISVGRLGNGPRAHYRIRQSELDKFLFGEVQE